MTHIEYNGFEYQIIQRQPPNYLNFWWRDLSIVEPETALEEYTARFDGSLPAELYSFMSEGKSWLALGPVDEAVNKVVLA